MIALNSLVNQHQHGYAEHLEVFWNVMTLYGK